MAEQNEELQKAIALMSEQVTANQEEFGHVLSGKRLVANNVNYPKNPDATAEIRRSVKVLMEGSLLVHLFAMWENHVPEKVQEWLTEEENQKLRAFMHVRNTAAHGFKGKRASSHRPQFEAEMPFSNIEWDESEDTIDISDSTVARDCHAFLAELTKQLVVRLAGSGPTVNDDD